MAELRCEQISAAYGDRVALSGVDLIVADGTLTAILGASGSGKTTLLRVVMGFLRQTHGTITVGGTVVAQAGDTYLAPEKRSIGYVAQEGALYPHLSVAENVAFGLPWRERKHSHRTAEVLELVGLNTGYSDRRPHELSGGEQRRVALARALVPSPPLVLLDEPFSGLDASLRADTRAAVLRALAAQGTTAVLVTHDQAEALSMGNEVAVLRAGELVQTAAPGVVYRSPADLDVARFVGEAVVLSGNADAGVVSCALGDLELVDRSLRGPVDAMIRPEQIRIVGRAAQGQADHTRLLATVAGRTFFGPETVVRLELEGVPDTITARILGHEAPAEGDRIELAVDGAVMAYPAMPVTGDGTPPTAEDLVAVHRIQ